MSTVGKILGAAGIATGVLGAAALGGVTAQRMSVRRYQSAQAALLTDPHQEDGYGLLKADRTYSVDTDDGVALHVEEVGPVTAPITVIFSHGWTLRSGVLALPAARRWPGPGFGEARPPTRRRRPATARSPRPAGLLRPALARQVDPGARGPLDDGLPGRRPAEHDRHRGAGRPGRADRALDGRDGDPDPGRARPGPVRRTDRRDRADLHRRHLPEVLRAQPAADDRRKPAGPGRHQCRGPLPGGVRTRPGQQPGRGLAAHPEPRVRPQGRARARWSTTWTR